MKIFNWLFLYRYGSIAGYVITLLSILTRIIWHLNFPDYNRSVFIILGPLMFFILIVLSIIGAVILLAGLISAFINKRQYKIKLYEIFNIPAFIIFLVTPYIGIFILCLLNQIILPFPFIIEKLVCPFLFIGY